MKIAIAQTEPRIGDQRYNLATHVELSKQAAEQGAKLILFPELSLTGYEPGIAVKLATDANDQCFEALQDISNTRAITICAGMPIRVAIGIQIAMLIFQPNQSRMCYAKQHLHTDEKPFFVEGDRQVLLEIGGHKLAPAICYEALLPEHAAQAAELEADIYLASVAKPAKGVAKAYAHLPAMAKQYNWHVAMCNAVGPCDNFVSAGASAIWNAQGVCMQKLDSQEEGILMMEI